MFNSSDNTFQNSRISYTGRSKPGYGEGLYVGTATARLNGTVDRSDRTKIISNQFGPQITAEHNDIKEDTHDGVIYNNTYDGAGQTGIHDSNTIVNLKGSGYAVSGNTVINGIQHGIRMNRINTPVDAFSGCNNFVFDTKCFNSDRTFKDHGYYDREDPALNSTLGFCLADNLICSNFITGISVTYTDGGNQTNRASVYKIQFNLLIMMTLFSWY
jgi:hypothetical protein